jgi:hypothetical protein
VGLISPLNIERVVVFPAPLTPLQQNQELAECQE